MNTIIKKRLNILLLTAGTLLFSSTIFALPSMNEAIEPAFNVDNDMYKILNDFFPKALGIMFIFTGLLHKFLHHSIKNAFLCFMSALLLFNVSNVISILVGEGSTGFMTAFITFIATACIVFCYFLLRVRQQDNIPELDHHSEIPPIEERMDTTKNIESTDSTFTEPQDNKRKVIVDK